MNNLKELAEAVQGWGNCTEAWLDTSEDDAAAVVGHIDDDGNTYPVTVIDCEQYFAGHDSLKLARFYAAANPHAVLTLLAEIESMRQQVTLLREVLGYWMFFIESEQDDEKQAPWVQKAQEALAATKEN